MAPITNCVQELRGQRFGVQEFGFDPEAGKPNLRT